MEEIQFEPLTWEEAESLIKPRARNGKFERLIKAIDERGGARVSHLSKSQYTGIYQAARKHNFHVRIGPAKDSSGVVIQRRKEDGVPS